MFEITSGPVKRAQKVVIYGPEGIGKSTLASQFPHPIFIDTEGGTSHLDVNRLPRPSSWEMLKQEVTYIKDNPVGETLVIDTADWAEKLAIDWICSQHSINGIEGLGYGKGYTYLEEEFGRFLNRLEDIINAGINVVLTAHAKITKFEQPEEMGAYDRWELKLQKKTAALVKEWADMVLFCNYKTIVVNVDNKGANKGKNKAQGGKRVIYTTHTPAWDAKNRHGLPAELDMSYSHIAYVLADNNQLMAEAAQQPRQQSSPQPDASVPFSTSEPTAQTQAPAPTPEDFSPREAEEVVDQALIDQVAAAFDEPGQLVKDKALNDLMVTNKVSVEEMQKIVADRGYYPATTPIDNYDQGFIAGVLVGAWDQVYAGILDNRNK